MEFLTPTLIKLLLIVMQALLALAGGMIVKLLTRVRDLEREHLKYQLHVSENYVNKDEFREIVGEIKSYVKDIYNILNKRHNKEHC